MQGLTNAEIQKRLSGEELAKSIALLETRWRKEDDPLIYENEYKAACNYIGLCNDNPDLVKLLSSLIGTKYVVDSFDDEQVRSDRGRMSGKNLRGKEYE